MQAYVIKFNILAKVVSNRLCYKTTKSCVYNYD